MNLDMYRRGSRYAWSLGGPGDHKDILHDAYLNFFEKKGKDLFDEHPGTVFKTIKLTFLNNLKKNHRYWNYKGEQFVTTVSDFEDQVHTSSTPESQFIDIEVKKNCARKVKTATELSNSRTNGGAKSRLDEVYELLVKGYALFEIALIMNLTRPAVTFYGHQLKKL